MTATDPSVDSQITSLSLLQRVRRNDRTAWNKFLQLYAPLVYRWAREFGLQDADAADLGQDVMMTVADKLSTFQRSQAGQSLRAWIRTITRNKCRDLMRAHKRHILAAGGTDAHRHLNNLPQAGANEELDDRVDDETAVIHAAVNLLREDFEHHTWQAFEQTAMKGRKASYVAADLGMSVGAVYTAKSRVLAKLRAEFDGLL